MFASVIIITKNQKSFLQKTLPFLLKQKIDGIFEIIVVDSGSTDGAVEYVKQLPVCLVEIRPEIFNFASAFNAGAKTAKGEFLVRLSGDVIPLNSDFLSELLKPFVDKKVGGTYGKYTIRNKSEFVYPEYWPKTRFPLEITRYRVKPNLLKILFSRKHSGLVYNFAGGCCAVRKSIWEKRPFNEKLIAAEDAEYSWFLHTIGLDIVCNPKAVVLHEHKARRKSFNLLPKWKLVFIWEFLKNYF